MTKGKRKSSKKTAITEDITPIDENNFQKILKKLKELRDFIKSNSLDISNDDNLKLKEISYQLKKKPKKVSERKELLQNAMKLNRSLRTKYKYSRT
jgi:pyruvate formate-lyase activating enzyme-like uncharacterized protein